jgi:SAM-dependent methyltransferase
MSNGSGTIIKKIILLAKSLADSTERKIFNFEDYVFEKRYSLELRGIVSNKVLSTEYKNSLPNAAAYQAVWCRNLRELFFEAKKTGYDFQNFVDVGSGKGKACFYAQARKEFDNIIGIEFSKPLVDIANVNKKKLNSQDITFLHADAAEFKLPNQLSFVFMFNPFDSVVLEKFISNNIDHFKKQKSIIAYANDIERMSFTKFGFATIFRNQTRRISLHQIS